VFAATIWRVSEGDDILDLLTECRRLSGEIEIHCGYRFLDTSSVETAPNSWSAKRWY
jgi:hypothetical protein